MSLAAITIAVAIAATKPPTQGATCYSDFLGLQTGNISMNQDLINDPSTNIVNIWAFVSATDKGDPPFAWLFKNAKGERLVQFNDYDIGYVRSVARSVGLQLATDSRGLHKLFPVDDKALVSFEDTLLAHNIVRVACFTRELDAK